MSRSALVSSSSPLRRMPERRRSLAGSSGTLLPLFDRELASTSGCLSNGKPKAIFSYRTLGRASPFGQEALTVPIGTRRSCPFLLSRSICSLCAASPCCNGYSSAQRRILRKKEVRRSPLLTLLLALLNTFDSVVSETREGRSHRDSKYTGRKRRAAF